MKMISTSANSILLSPPLNTKFDNTDYLVFMCHEIGSPLAAIIGLSKIFTNQQWRTHKEHQCAAMLKITTEMLMGTMKTMLDFLKPGAGMGQVDTIEFDLLKTVQQTVYNGKPDHGSLYLHVHIANGISSQSIGDPLCMSTILIALLQDTVKFAKKGNIELHTSKKTDENGKNHLSIVAIDTGTDLRPSL